MVCLVCLFVYRDCLCKQKARATTSNQPLSRDDWVIVEKWQSTKVLTGFRLGCVSFCVPVCLNGFENVVERIVQLLENRHQMNKTTLQNECPWEKNEQLNGKRLGE